jgi:hypothetical protein
MSVASPTSARVAPPWVEQAFRLAAGEQQAFTVDGITFDLCAEAFRLDPGLRSLQIMGVTVPEKKLAKHSVSLLLDLKAGARRYARPLEGRIVMPGITREDDPDLHNRMMHTRICGWDHLGFHVTESASYETLSAVSIAHLPDGLDLPFTDAHRILARHVIGLHDGCHADRNALLVGVATPDYARLMELCAMGYAMRAECVAGRTHFGLTPRGFAEVMRPGESTIWGMIPERIVLRGDDIHGL